MNRKTQMKDIILVEDNPDMNYVLTNLFKKNGYTVDSFKMGEPALEKLKSNHYKIIIADYNLPGITGLDVLAIVSNKYTDMQKIIITAYGDNKVRENSESLKAKYLNKPFDNKYLMEIIFEFLQGNNIRGP